MKSYTEYLTFNIPSKMAFVNITPQVEEAVRKSGGLEGAEGVEASRGSLMKSYTEYLTFNIPSKMAFVNITPQVEEAVRKSGVLEGLVLCNAMHITASVLLQHDHSGPHQ